MPRLAAGLPKQRPSKSVPKKEIPVYLLRIDEFELGGEIVDSMPYKGGTGIVSTG